MTHASQTQNSTSGQKVPERAAVPAKGEGVLIAGEESGATRDAFIRRGYRAFSCDLKPSAEPGPHFQRSWHEVIPLRRWALIIFHPVCTKVCLSGNGTYGRGKDRHQERLDAIRQIAADWALVRAHADRAVLENPTGVIWTDPNGIGPADQWIQPYEYGHGETKRTGLRLHNLPRLVATNPVAGREQRVWKMPPGPERATLRARTYQGWADAFADQWGPLLERQREAA